ncbi:glycosyltransferase 87 family protein [Rickettsiella endosymbiont of Aleochara curtula]|uniref:glycosyltransferase 87 family protein n=1 Tax=Rickettsiella endosymbiont of Aleochara curtula TaxID=3077936 RepID=UPI00313E94CA
MSLYKGLFPTCQLSKADYFLGGILFLFCYFAFFQGDIIATGWNSLNYLYGNPLDFYQNCRKIVGQGIFDAASYPPSIFLIFAVWLLPFKLLGFITSPHYFPIYLVYWLKALTSLVYAVTGLVFYRVTQIYQTNQKWGIYSTWIWLTSPLAFFSQFIFSQYDIFYVFLTLLGFLFFLEKKIYWASFVFGLAITFKYFPFFVFIPLLLFFEKKIIKIILCGLIFSIPTLIIQGLYIHSPAYVAGVLEFSPLARVFSAGLTYNGQKIYYIFSVFLMLSGITYYLDLSENYKKIAAFIFLSSSIFPFLFITWHPQWLIFITPAMALTTVLSQKNKISKLLFFDLCGMLFFIAYTVLSFQDNVDLNMLQTKLFHIPFQHNQNMSVLFRVFKNFSANVYLSLFWGYLILQLILKYQFVLINSSIKSGSCLYTKIRQRYYIGIFIFIMPASIMFIINSLNSDRYIASIYREKTFGELTANRIFEQSFKAKGSELKQIDLFLATFSRKNNKDIQLEILTRDHKSLYTIKRKASHLQDNSWEAFKLPNIKTKKNNIYYIRLTSPTSYLGNAISWWASEQPHYKNGSAIVDGKPQGSDFAFRLKFNKI